MHTLRRRTRLTWKGLLLAVLAAALFLLLLVAGGGWYYAGALSDGALAVDHDPDEFDLKVTALRDSSITLQPVGGDDDGDWTHDGVFGLEWQGGYAQVGAIMEISDDEVVREFLPSGAAPEVGVRARLDSFAFAGDPLAGRGLSYIDVVYTSPLGDFPAWLVRGERDVWAVFVHGKGADREEALRMLPTVAERGLPSLIITYRNDDHTPHEADNRYHYGETEWEDLQAAVEYALRQGAKRVVLVGYSMGGAIVVNFLYQSALADRVDAVILDSPVLDFEAAIDWGARHRFLPWPLAGVGKAIADMRFDIDWNGLDYLKQSDKLSVPILLFHGDVDKKVPVSTSDKLAAARPDLVTYARVAGAGHVRAWNSDPDAYEANVQDFLARAVP